MYGLSAIVGIAEMIIGRHRRGQPPAIVIGAVYVAGHHTAHQRDRGAADRVVRRMTLRCEFRRIVHVAHRRRRSTDHSLQRAVTVGIACYHIDDVPDIGIIKCVGGASGAGDVDAVALPLVADRTDPVGVRQRGAINSPLLLSGSTSVTVMSVAPASTSETEMPVSWVGVFATAIPLCTTDTLSSAAPA